VHNVKGRVGQGGTTGWHNITGAEYGGKWG
jgi:hypothetical protein